MIIRISSGYTGSVVVDVEDSRGTDLSTATLRLGLFTTSLAEDLPAASDAGWKTPTTITYPALGKAKLALSVSEASGYTLDVKYWAWVRATSSPFLTPVLARDESVTLV